MRCLPGDGTAAACSRATSTPGGSSADWPPSSSSSSSSVLLGRPTSPLRPLLLLLLRLRLCIGPARALKATATALRLAGSSWAPATSPGPLRMPRPSSCRLHWEPVRGSGGGGLV